MTILLAAVKCGPLNYSTSCQVVVWYGGKSRFCGEKYLISSAIQIVLTPLWFLGRSFSLSEPIPSPSRGNVAWAD